MLPEAKSTVGQAGRSSRRLFLSPGCGRLSRRPTRRLIRTTTDGPSGAGAHSSFYAICGRLLVVLSGDRLALASAPAAYAKEPTIVTDITFPEEGEPFGTFTALDPLCPSGTFVDKFVGGVTVRKTLTCADGSGSFTILFHPLHTPATPEGCQEAGPFSVKGGTDAYARLRGHGRFCNFPVEDGVTETFTGTFRLG
jgi:hypothetical protein